MQGECGARAWASDPPDSALNAEAAASGSPMVLILRAASPGDGTGHRDQTAASPEAHRRKRDAKQPGSDTVLRASAVRAASRGQGITHRGPGEGAEVAPEASRRQPGLPRRPQPRQLLECPKRAVWPLVTGLPLTTRQSAPWEKLNPKEKNRNKSAAPLKQGAPSSSRDTPRGTSVALASGRSRPSALSAVDPREAARDDLPRRDGQRSYRRLPSSALPLGNLTGIHVEQ